MVNSSSPSSPIMTPANTSTLFDTALPPLPPYALRPKADLIPWLPDFWLSLVLPVAVYWALSLAFHAVDALDLCPRHRLHTPAEIARRNRASRAEVARDVVLQQLIQVATGAALQIAEPPELVGREAHDLARWATGLRLAQRAVPRVLAAVGINATAAARNMAPAYPQLAAVLAGGYYPFLRSADDQVPLFAPWETLLAGAIYNVVVPLAQFFVAVFFLDTWQYFLHRLMHMNRWLYTTFHSRHHRLYVPYAFGALYNHPFEGFLLDTLGAGIAFKLTGMTTLQGTCFFTFSTMKTVDDHCGYAFPWDPLQLITNNNAAYHDIHHQTWGIKTNFSQPFFTFWDRILKTRYNGPRADRLADKKRVEEKEKAEEEAVAQGQDGVKRK